MIGERWGFAAVDRYIVSRDQRDRKALSCHQLDFDLLAQRASSTIEGSESDRSILRIKQSMNSGSGGSHFCRQGAFAQILFLHQVVHFQGHNPLERCGLNLFDRSLFSEETPEVTATAMFVSRLNYMTVSFLIHLPSGIYTLGLRVVNRSAYVEPPSLKLQRAMDYGATGTALHC